MEQVTMRGTGLTFGRSRSVGSGTKEAPAWGELARDPIWKGLACQQKELPFSPKTEEPLRRCSSLVMLLLYSLQWLPMAFPNNLFLALAFKAQHNVDLTPLAIRTPAIPSQASPPTAAPLPKCLPRPCLCPLIGRCLHPNAASATAPPARNCRIHQGPVKTSRPPRGRLTLSSLGWTAWAAQLCGLR